MEAQMSVTHVNVEPEVAKRRLVAMASFHERAARAYRSVGKVADAEAAERMAANLRKRLGEVRR